MSNSSNTYKYLLRIADDASIQGHRLAELCSRGPSLEEDLAISNMALDQIGRAQAFYKYAAEVEGKNRNEDELAYTRDERHFYNHLMSELPNSNFAFTIAKQLLLSCFDTLFFQSLSQSKDPTIAGISAKAYKESRYHLTHAQDWCHRLGLGTAMSNELLQKSMDDLWMYTNELFDMDEVDHHLIETNLTIDLKIIQCQWIKIIHEVLIESDIRIPNVDYMIKGGKFGIHTENLGHILSEMQYLQKSYPGAKW